MSVDRAGLEEGGARRRRIRGDPETGEVRADLDRSLREKSGAMSAAGDHLEHANFEGPSSAHQADDVSDPAQ